MRKKEKVIKIINKIDRIHMNDLYTSLERKKQLERERIQKEQEKAILEKIRKMMEVSSRIKLDMMQNVLKIDKSTFSNKIFEWARQFNFIIDGDYLNIDKDSVTDFITELDRQFESWRKDNENIID